MSDFGLYFTTDSFTNYDVGDSYFIGLTFDKIKTFYSFENNLFDFIILDHIVQQIDNLHLFFDNCKRVLKKEGKIIILVPDLFLNEKFIWPSRNKNNLYSFSLKYSNHVIRRNDHWHIESNFVDFLNNYEFKIVESILQDNLFDYKKSLMNSENNSVFIKIIIKNK